MNTVIEILQDRAEREPDRPYCSLLPDGINVVKTLTYSMLEARAKAIAAVLQEGAKVGERALLLYPQGLEFIETFFGCLYAGIIAIPAYLPRKSKQDNRIIGIIRDASPTIICGRNAEALEGKNLSFPSVRRVETDSIVDESASLWRPPASLPTLAFLQYTSGSTTEPRGVMVSHANLLANSACLKQAAQYTRDTIAITWLPHFHDMGLIEGLLQPLIHGFRTYWMPATAFLQRPLRWLEAITKYRAHHSGAPNFAYDLCVKALERNPSADLNLKTWTLAYSGAEPIRVETLEAFAQAFCSYGFRGSALYAAYGLAEATLQVAGGTKAAGPKYLTVSREALVYHRVQIEEGINGVKGQTLVSCGRALCDMEIAIVSPSNSSRCSEREVGEIWLRGASVANGYWQREQETEDTFNGRISPTGEGPYLRTGDLGFLDEGHLYVTGRLKDMIIINGRNHYPQDIERTIRAAHASVVDAVATSCNLVNNAEEIILFLEVSRSLMREGDLIDTPRTGIEEVVLKVNKNVIQDHDLRADRILVLPPASLPRTSSGKKQRTLCQRLYRENQLIPMYRWSARHISVSGDHREA